MQDIDTKVDFARSLAVFSILLLVLAPLAGLYEWRRSKTYPVRQVLYSVVMFLFLAFVGKIRV